MSVYRRSPMRKGALPAVAMVLVIVAGAMVAEGVYLNNLVKDLEVIKRSAREMVVVSAVNTIEFRKRALQNAVAYSFQSAAAEAMALGGFCEQDASDCEAACKVPGAVPTLGCVPWWKVYDDVYAPAEEGGARPFIGYLKNRTAAVYDAYAKSISKGGLQYCPSEAAFAVERSGSYEVRVSTTSSASALQNRKDIHIADKTDTVVITESNTAFSSAFESPELELFSFARGAFGAGNDAIKSAFTKAEAGMPDICREASVGDVCEDKAGSSMCRSRLSNSCTIDAGGSGCDSDGDGKLTADERYRCSVESNLGEQVASADGRLVATVSVGCLKTSHSSSISGTTTHDCSDVLAEGCGCDQRCTPAMCGCAAEGSECRPDCCTTYLGSKVSGYWERDAITLYWSFKCSGAAEGCGLASGCCLRPDGVVKDAVCSYDYFGSANASVSVTDAESSYPYGSSWRNPSLQFYVASGNAGCGSVKASDNPTEPGGACCAVTSTDAADESSGCKAA